MGKERSPVKSGRRQRYSKEFKLEAVRLLELGQKPATDLALELGIRRNQLYKWQRDLRAKNNWQGQTPIKRSNYHRLA